MNIHSRTRESSDVFNILDEIYNVLGIHLKSKYPLYIISSYQI